MARSAHGVTLSPGVLCICGVVGGLGRLPSGRYGPTRQTRAVPTPAGLSPLHPTHKVALGSPCPTNGSLGSGSRWVAGCRGPRPQIGGRGGLSRTGEPATRPARGGAAACRPPLGPITGTGGGRRDHPGAGWTLSRPPGARGPACKQARRPPETDLPWPAHSAVLGSHTAHRRQDPGIS